MAQDVDFENGIIEVCKSTSIIKEGKRKNKQVLKGTKNFSSTRKVSVPPGVLNILQEWKEAQEVNRLKFGEHWKYNNFIFTQWNGSQMDLSTPQHAFQKIIARHNEENEEKLPEITLHGLRHSLATLQIGSGIDIKTVSQRLGHADTSTTLNIYSHMLEKNEKEAALLMERLLTEE